MGVSPTGLDRLFAWKESGDSGLRAMRESFDRYRFYGEHLPGGAGPFRDGAAEPG